MSSLPYRAPTVEELQPHFPQYALERFVAGGGMGAVYLARQVSVDRAVAVKILPPDLATDEKFRERFAMEARAMAKLSHRNLVQIYDFGETDGIVWMIQEWVSGRTIYEVLTQEGRLEPGDAAALVAQACEGLGYAHQQGIVHRDVKPGNMMENSDGNLKLMDFGLARATNGGPAGLRAEGEARFATEEYAAPELWDLDREIDHRVDIFALGVLLYEALTGARPTGTFRMPSEVRPGLDPRYDAIVVKAMQRKPENRYNSCGELLADLREVVTTAPRSAGVRLKTAAKPASGSLKLAMPAGGPERPSGAVMVGAGVKVPTTKKKGSAGLLLVGVVSILGVLAATALVISALKEDEPVPEPGSEPAAKVVTAPADPRRETRPTSRPRKEPAETPEARAERRIREQQARLQEMERNRPKPGPGSPARIAAQLEKIDTDLRNEAFEALAAYKDAVGSATEKYLARCEAGQREAADQLALDALIVWRQEWETMKREGEPSRSDGGVPGPVLALRKAWREQIDPRQKTLLKLQSIYLAGCETLVGETKNEKARALIAERIEAASGLAGFLVLCDGGTAVVPEQRTGIVDELPGNFGVADRAVKSALADYRVAGKTEAMKSLVAVYGKRLMESEAALREQRKDKDARAIGALKEEMIALHESLKKAETGGSRQALPGKERAVQLLENGAPTEECLCDRKEWRRRGRLIENSVENAMMQSRLAIGPGDFRIRIVMNWERIGATGALVQIGDTHLVLDGEDGVTRIGRAGAFTQVVNGKSFGGMARAGTAFECLVTRAGEQLRVTIDGQESLIAPIHSLELGRAMLRTGTAEVSVAEFEVSGNLMEAPDYQVLASHKLPKARVGMTQLLRTEKEGVVALFVGYDTGDASDGEIWMRRSRNLGEKWEDPELVSAEEHGKRKALSFGAVSIPDRNEIWMVYAVGDANHEIFVRHSRTGGQTWSRAVEITGVAKEAGWNVTFAANGVVLAHDRNHEGRMLIPMMVGPLEEKRGYLLLSDDGKDWTWIGPVFESAAGFPEIIEDREGALWMTTAMRKGERSGYRPWSKSEDGGETWSAPTESRLPDAWDRGSLALGQDREGQPVWYHAAVEGPPGKDGPPRTNLTLFASRDSGQSWERLQRFHFGFGFSPSLLPVGPGRCLVVFRREVQWSQGIEMRFADLVVSEK